MKTQIPSRRFIRTPDVNHLYGIPPTTLYSLEAQGKIRGVRMLVRKRAVKLWSVDSIERCIAKGGAR